MPPEFVLSHENTLYVAIANHAGQRPYRFLAVIVGPRFPLTNLLNLRCVYAKEANGDIAAFDCICINNRCLASRRGASNVEQGPITKSGTAARRFCLTSSPSQ